jgi:hypothetical protein
MIPWCVHGAVDVRLRFFLRVFSEAVVDCTTVNSLCNLIYACVLMTCFCPVCRRDSLSRVTIDARSSRT